MRMRLWHRFRMWLRWGRRPLPGENEERLRKLEDAGMGL